MTEQEATAILGKSVWEAQGKLTALWPTPRAGTTTDEDEAVWQARKDWGDVATPPLALAVQMFPTRGATETKMWWTPSAALAFGDFALTPDVAHREQSGGNLHRQVAQELFPHPTDRNHDLWPTPVVSDSKGGNNPDAPSTLRDAQRHLLRGSVVYHEQQHNKRLSARWVNRMMGLPDGWLHSEPTPLLDPRWNGNPLAAFGPDWEDGVPRVVEQEDHRVHKLKALGNGIVPQVAWCLLVAMDEAGWS
jgi:hypothetical protein